MKFIDLFAGLGGFHLALKQLGHECVFASEINPNLRAIYEKNFNFLAQGDIRQINAENIPAHTILCAGFPCQPFSKAGDQIGFESKDNGNLFDEITRILDHRKPHYIILENVANLKKHDKGKTWSIIKNKLEVSGYEVEAEILSPHDFGIPQIRQRMFIVGSRTGLKNFIWPPKQHFPDLSMEEILEDNPTDAVALPERIQGYLNVWQDFLDRLGDHVLPLPIWSMEFGATYPYEDRTPFSAGLKELQEFRGSFGAPLRDLPEEQIANALPTYAYKHPKAKVDIFPRWKVNFIRKNRQFYETHKDWLGEWIPKVKSLHPSFQKFEWNCHGDKRDIWQLVVQLRASGIRVKRRKTASSLVGITTQIPIIAWEKRYMTIKEGAKLQSMEDLSCLPSTPYQGFTALGNAVNVKLVKLIAQSLISESQ